MGYHRGKASSHSCSWCENQARHWAQLHETDGSDIWNDYIPLCFKCHMAYDLGGRERPEEVKQKISATKQANPYLGREKSPEERQGIRERMLGHEVTPETRKKISKGLTGHTVSAETRAKISATKRARKSQ